MATPDGSRDIPKQLATTDAKRAAKRQATKAIKRRKTLLGKADDLHKDCGYDVLLALQKGHRSYIYTSVDTPGAIEDLMKKYLLPSIYTPDIMKSKKGKRSGKVGRKRSSRNA